MTDSASMKAARLLALGVPALLLGGAYISQFGFGLYPCEMCWWQRYPHFAALGFGLAALFVPPVRLWLALAALAILASGAIGGFHAGVEYGWWQGITDCALVAGGDGGDALKAVFDAPLTRCDQAPWDLFGVSLAGWNFLVSTFAGLLILFLLAKRHTA
ncbi:disulfide bond formation protein B [Parerythrobacter lacustris]|uniref:Disulfide bond formation protein B n=1 Tax=Parerythrobacter lacustris TaxID=2969984 RepID=A0ABT1XS21_9SPHN|nr:disulfide bond formation protein B [Parerythrobacter lacustris]MCR2834417.1 disulfide bond formation protein B [Parerythrobacter lacustris]